MPDQATPHSVEWLVPSESARHPAGSSSPLWKQALPPASEGEQDLDQLDGHTWCGVFIKVPQSRWWSVIWSGR